MAIWIALGVFALGRGWGSPWPWIDLSVLIGLGATIWGRREKSHQRRQGELILAVRQRTDELNGERLKERERSRILEMLVTNEPLGSVLDATVRLVRDQVPQALCAILLRRPDECRIGAAPDFPREWLVALQTPQALPFEIWRQPMLHRDLFRNPAWRVFAARVGPEFSDPGSARGPVSIYSSPIGGVDVSLGALLLCYPAGMEPGINDADAAEHGQRLAGIAIEHSRLYDDLHFQAHHDSLTRLPNRMLFEKRLKRSLKEADVLNKRVALLFIDLDGFKAINDTLSHRVGDLFLCEIANRMTRTMRPGDAVARIGGDEFTIIVTGLTDTSEAEEIADRVLEAMRQPMIVDGHELAATASAGIAIYPDDGTEPEQLQRGADSAMYCAKNMGRNRVQAFAARNDTLDRVRMDEELRLALRRSWFVVHYQPKVRADGSFAGVEALVRMNHPKYGEIPPANFISVAEENGLIVQLGEWVLQETCRQAADWQRRGFGQIPVALKISPIQLSRSSFAQTVVDCLARHGVSPQSLELELTETVLMSCAPPAQEQMKELRALGIRLSLDHFGTGYSSLSYLHRLQVDAIKLDKSFVQAIETDEQAFRLIQAMIGVAEGLGLGVIAEGVETEGQREALVRAGCPVMQGYLFARPQPPGDLEPQLRKSLSRTLPSQPRLPALERRGGKIPFCNPTIM